MSVRHFMLLRTFNLNFTATSRGIFGMHHSYSVSILFSKKIYNTSRHHLMPLENFPDSLPPMERATTGLQLLPLPHTRIVHSFSLVEIEGSGALQDIVEHALNSV